MQFRYALIKFPEMIILSYFDHHFCCTWTWCPDRRPCADGAAVAAGPRSNMHFGKYTFDGLCTSQTRSLSVCSWVCAILGRDRSSLHVARSPVAAGTTSHKLNPSVSKRMYEMSGEDWTGYYDGLIYDKRLSCGSDNKRPEVSDISPVYSKFMFLN